MIGEKNVVAFDFLQALTTPDVDSNHAEASQETTADSAERADDGKQLCAIVLNRPLSWSTISLLQNADQIIIADGGADRLLTAIEKSVHSKEEATKRADVQDASIASFFGQLKAYLRGQLYVVGDLDSISERSRQVFRELNVEVHDRSDDQDSTDLEKAILLYLAKRPEATDDEIVGVGCFGGRLDHEIANISLLYKYHARLGNRRLYLTGGSNLSFLLTSPTRLKLPCRWFAPTCGLLPIGHPVGRVKTSGLRWNLDGNRCLSVGECVSSSNELLADRGEGDSDASEKEAHYQSVVVETYQPLVWYSETKF